MSKDCRMSIVRNIETLLVGIFSPEQVTIISNAVTKAIADYEVSERCTDVASLISDLASNPLQVVYRLATPITYQLTPQEVATLLGHNNIWADTGDTAVKYTADTKLYIDKKLAELTS